MARSNHEERRNDSAVSKVGKRANSGRFNRFVDYRASQARMVSNQEKGCHRCRSRLARKGFNYAAHSALSSSARPAVRAAWSSSGGTMLFPPDIASMQAVVRCDARPTLPPLHFTPFPSVRMATELRGVNILSLIRCRYRKAHRINTAR